MKQQQQGLEQEEEWDREGLLDPAWGRQQRKVQNAVHFSEVTVLIST